ncbi:MAG: hypothetical protein F4W90_12455 [Gammaproteobacteria bacterium]|nr:hypothetical protein [Gammaproteobacteria bacterium]
MKYLEYEGFSLRPQPLAHMPLATVIGLLPETHYVCLETSDGNYAALVDGVLYDTEDWREDQLTYVTNFWQLGDPSRSLSGNLCAQMLDVNGDEVAEFEFNQLDDMIREPLALAPYAFFTRSLDHAWRPEPAGEFTFKCTYFVKLRSHGEKIAVASDSLPCSARYMDVFEQPVQDHSETGWHHQLFNRLMKDAHRFLSAFDVAYQEIDDNTIQLEGRMSYAVKSGQVVRHLGRKQRSMGRGYRRLRRSLIRPHTLGS